MLKYLAVCLVAACSAEQLQESEQNKAASSFTEFEKCIRIHQNRLSSGGGTHEDDFGFRIVDTLADGFQKRALAISPSVIPCGQINTAYAHVVRTRKEQIEPGEYIIYNPDWLRAVAGTDENLAYVIFGHELGHFVNRDFYPPNNQLSLTQRELNADKFAGCALAVVLGDELALVDLMERLRLSTSNAYPSRAQSIEIAQDGYDQCASETLQNIRIQEKLNRMNFDIDQFDGTWTVSTDTSVREFLRMTNSSSAYGAKQSILDVIQENVDFDNFEMSRRQTWVPASENCRRMLNAGETVSTECFEGEQLFVTSCKSEISCPLERILEARNRTIVEKTELSDTATATLSRSDLAVRMAARFEGFSATPYNNASGFCTIGFGHVIAIKSCEELDSAEFVPFEELSTQEEWLQLLSADLRTAFTIVDDLVEVELQPYQRAALSTFVFNAGGSAFEKSSLLKALNDGAIDSVPNQMKRWVYSGGKIAPGLVSRRRCEADMFLGRHEMQDFIDVCLVSG
ncbi:MAG: glycoside hydrolase family protein [Pseudomonadota bacterium]